MADFLFAECVIAQVAADIIAESGVYGDTNNAKRASLDAGRKSTCGNPRAAFHGEAGRMKYRECLSLLGRGQRRDAMGSFQTHGALFF
jgi:hypothetical protein